MAMLDHLIVPSHDRKPSAKLLADLLGVKSGESFGLFSAVYVNETLTIDFMQGDKFDVHHYCFSVTDEEFETILARLRENKIPYRSSPHGPMDMYATNPATVRTTISKKESFMRNQRY